MNEWPWCSNYKDVHMMLYVWYNNMYINRAKQIEFDVKTKNKHNEIRRATDFCPIRQRQPQCLRIH